ncbi:multifunctional expression regulator [bovine alphaherpesvirus 1]|uniref:Multifunctional expression regulator n=1 Tax=Bovine herpesvirus 1 TaxID=10320 RepID=A0A0U2UMQ8_BHV1|nr:UL54 protein [Bovine herpesvirus type 1.1]ALR87771.1 multifunctional expression regulator [Bovine alphaherpesvirus 1]AFV53364.1 UL54 protein [Bovine herpesvirus type 1.1]APW77329.1 multifunctional expression regulator [Bovine alphaherpesvirus 1]AVM39152.1 mRNA export factor ICP27 [Bovine alphaherpesvirus 1]AVM39303.1 mRNA export factor ICP27 [Bovine alphaherpesvirus 1]
MADPEIATLSTASESDDLSLFGSDREEDDEAPSLAPALRSVVGQVRKRKLEGAEDEPMPAEPPGEGAASGDGGPAEAPPARRARVRPRRPRRRPRRRQPAGEQRSRGPAAKREAALATSSHGGGGAAARSIGSSLRLARSLAEAAQRATAERVTAVFAGARLDLMRPVQNGGFRAAGVSPWAAVLDFGAEQFVPEGRRVTWETLMFHGRDLYRMFEVRSHAAQAARALRDLVLRNENLVDALASADECLTWCKFIATKNLRLRTKDPIVATAGAVLENLRLKLAPFLRCYLRGRGLPSLEELCAARRLSLATCPASYMFVMLARLSRAVRSGAECVPLLEVTVGDAPFEEYIPGACVAGLIDALDTHKQACDSMTCKLVANFTLVPVYMHGKYFYCNEIF